MLCWLCIAALYGQVRSEWALYGQVRDEWLVLLPILARNLLLEQLLEPGDGGRRSWFVLVTRTDHTLLTKWSTMPAGFGSEAQSKDRSDVGIDCSRNGSMKRRTDKLPCALAA